MSNSIAQNTANSAKTLAQQIAKQMAREPLEILKDVKEQTTGRESSPGRQEEQPEQKHEDEEKLKQNDQVRSARLIEAYQREIEDIRKQKMFAELQERIMSGEEVPLEDYPELTLEQKQVLKAQMEAVKVRMQNQQQNFNNVPSIHSKPSRRFGAGQKQAAEKEQTRVEKPVPPSG